MFLRPVIVLHAAGNRHIGVGHLSRTATLARALLKTNVWQRILVIWEAPPELVEHFAPEGCEVLGVEDRETALDWRSLLAPPGTYAILVADLPQLEAAYVQTARDDGYRLCVHLADRIPPTPVADMVVSESTVQTTAEMAKPALLGHPYRIIRESVCAKRPDHPWQGDRPQRILLTLGGADPGHLTYPLLQQLRPLLEPADLSLTATLGPAFHPNHRFQIQEFAQTCDRIQLADTPTDLTELILAHDLTLTLGGISSYEAMCLGRPCGAIAWDAMTSYVEALAAQNLLENLGTLDQISETLQTLIHQPQRLRELAEKGWKTIDGQGGDRIANALCAKLPTSRLFHQSQ